MSKLNFNFLNKKVINEGLCSMCGTCVGVCPQNVIGYKNNIEYTPVWLNVNGCINCGFCVDSCPGRGYKIEGLNKTHTNRVGKYKDILRGFSTDKFIYENSSSGGISTATLKYLLDKNIANEVIVVKNSDSIKDSYAEVLLTYNLEDVYSSMQSKYIQLPISNVFSKIRNSKKKYALVALPCHLAGLEMAINKYPELNSKIVFKIGLFCGFTYTHNSVNQMIKYMGLSMNDVKRIIGWREGGLPGEFTIELLDGSIKRIPFKHEHSINVTFFSQNRCNLCKDCLAEYGDIALGDIGNWKSKETLIIARTHIGAKILNEMDNVGLLNLNRIDIKYELNNTVIPFMLREKRNKVDVKINYLKEKGIATPTWDNECVENSKTLKIEAILSLVLQRMLRKEKVMAYLSNNPRLIYFIGQFVYLGIRKNKLIKIFKKIEAKLRKNEEIII